MIKQKLELANYPNLRQLMAKYNLTKGDIAKIINKSYRTTLKRMNKEIAACGKMSKFDIEEAMKIVNYFKELGEPVTTEYIFFDSMVTNVTRTA